MMTPTNVAVDMPAFSSVAGSGSGSGSAVFPGEVAVGPDRSFVVGVVFATPVVVASFDAGAVVSYPFSSQYRR